MREGEPAVLVHHLLRRVIILIKGFRILMQVDMAGGKGDGILRPRRLGKGQKVERIVARAPCCRPRIDAIHAIGVSGGGGVTAENEIKLRVALDNLAQRQAKHLGIVSVKEASIS